MSKIYSVYDLTIEKYKQFSLVFELFTLGLVDLKETMS